jgi:NAD(P)H-dependent FMN reductase
VTNIAVVIGSTRDGRFGDRPAKWIHGHLQKSGTLTARMLDLRDYPLPFFDQKLTPSNPNRPPFSNEAVRRWTAEIAAADGFIFVAAEHNFGPPAVLKNTLDWVYPEWNRKPAAFVSYGVSSGARSVHNDPSDVGRHCGG